MPDRRDTNRHPIPARVRFETVTERTAAWDELWLRLLRAVCHQLPNDLDVRAVRIAGTHERTTDRDSRDCRRLARSGGHHYYY